MSGYPPNFLMLLRSGQFQHNLRTAQTIPAAMNILPLGRRNLCFKVCFDLTSRQQYQKCVKD